MKDAKFHSNKNPLQKFMLWLAFSIALLLVLTGQSRTGWAQVTVDCPDCDSTTSLAGIAEVAETGLGVAAQYVGIAQDWLLQEYLRGETVVHSNNLLSSLQLNTGVLGHTLDNLGKSNSTNLLGHNLANNVMNHPVPTTNNNRYADAMMRSEGLFSTLMGTMSLQEQWRTDLTDRDQYSNIADPSGPSNSGIVGLVRTHMGFRCPSIATNGGSPSTSWRCNLDRAMPGPGWYMMRPTPGKDLSVDTGDTGPTPSTSDPTLAPEVRYMAALNYIQNIAPKQPYTLIIQNDNALDTAYGECESAEAPHIYVIANYLAKLTMPGCSTAQDSATQAICAQQYRACAVDGMDPACTDNGTAFGNSNFNGKSYYELASFQAASCATQAEGVGPSGSLTTGGDVNGGTEEMKNCSNRGDKWYKDWGEGEAMFAKAIEGLKTVRKECWNTHNWLGPLKVITGDASGTPQTTTKSLAQCTTATEPVKKVKAAREDKGGKKDAGAPPAVQVRADNDNALPVGVPVAADEAVVVPAMYRR